MLVEYIRELEAIALVVSVADLGVKTTLWLDLDDLKALYSKESDPGEMHFLEQNISAISAW